MQKHLLICLPFAGGSKYSMRFLEPLLPRHIACHFLEYAGHGGRNREPFSESMEALVDDLYGIMAPLTGTTYSIYGHSMGATVACLLARKIRQEGKPMPQQVIVSGTDGPSVPPRTAPKHLMPRDEFLEAIRKLGGLPDEILEDQELLEYFEPVLRADFRVIEEFTYQPAERLNIPFTVVTGDEEDMPDEDILQWQRETSLPIRLFKLPGNHFFIYEQGRELAYIIGRAAEPVEGSR